MKEDKMGVLIEPTEISQTATVSNKSVDLYLSKSHNGGDYCLKGVKNSISSSKG
ncbi:hypothetical protein Phum_PHUM361210 [Pediculus humanus corporis]|uniref:Uncharacterized protein n=1 Tax=Pediculus humanus subsp. corporis TaxID=121224 RepID=E0VPK5_PEDHC|nr:uncharacterized protein Phum_PHUM361210 [Pediculus humanus corporis]EEB15311.1 hypothetical protein Phum_PHUM361210 [Pediculus humanus corporis]